MPITARRVHLAARPVSILFQYVVHIMKLSCFSCFHACHTDEEMSRFRVSNCHHCSTPQTQKMPSIGMPILPDRLFLSPDSYSATLADTSQHFTQRCNRLSCLYASVRASAGVACVRSLNAGNQPETFLAKRCPGLS